MKTCSKNHINPDIAKFCRICGEKFPISNSESDISKGDSLKKGKTRFTLDIFPDINLVPRSIYEISFGLKPTIACVIIAFLIFWLCNFTRFYHIIYESCPLSYAEIDLLLFTEFTFSMFLFVVLLRRIYKKSIYDFMTEYVEKDNISGSICRIAKQGKLGLFDSKKKRILLFTKYDNITVFDECHFLIEQNQRKGIYSIKKRKLIIPVEFNSVEPFVSSIAKACLNGVEYHFDVNGNSMR